MSGPPFLIGCTDIPLCAAGQECLAHHQSANRRGSPANCAVSNNSAQCDAAHSMESFVMASRRFSRKPPLEVCSEWLADDGIDPRLVRKERGKVSNRKALQLCRQVEHALVFALAGELLRDRIVR